MDHTIFRSLLQVDDIPRIPSIQWCWCTNRNWYATVPTTGASSTDGVGSWAAHVGHRIQPIARELRFDRSPTGCPGSKTLADDRLIPEEGVLVLPSSSVGEESLKP